MTDEQPTTPHQQSETLEAAQQRANEFEAKWKRVLADYQNREKDIARERSEFARFAAVGVIRDLLPVFDALHAAAATDAHMENLVKLCADFLKKQGVEPVGKVGDRVDYLLHEVVATRTEEGMEAGMILEVAHVGYTMDGRLLRPAKVIVCTEKEK